MDYQPKILRVLRAQQGYAQKVMADKLDISISQYSKIESGEKPLHVEMLIKLAEIFHLTPSQLLEEITVHRGTTQGYFGERAAAEARKASFDAEKNGEELAYYKKLASHFEDRYMQLFFQFVERSRTNDPERGLPEHH